jgi:hypothetical protein
MKVCNLCKQMFCGDCDNDHQHCDECFSTVCSECLREQDLHSFESVCDLCFDTFCTKCDRNHEQCINCNNTICTISRSPVSTTPLKDYLFLCLHSTDLDKQGL